MQIALLTVAALCLTQQDPQEPHLGLRSNVLIILADDVGVEALQRYGRHSGQFANTPNIDALAEQGLLFQRAWVAPECSPTRATLQTGRYGCRTGIGRVIGAGTVSLNASSENLAPALSASGYRTAAFGKWHLSATSNPCSPIVAGGYDWFEGTVDTVVSSYCSWNKLTVSSGCANPTTSLSQTYMPSAIFNAASSWVGEGRGSSDPWMVYCAPQAPFERHHVPPADLHNQPLAAASCSSSLQPLRAFMAALEAMDTKIGHALAKITAGQSKLGQYRPWYTNTTVIFMGDNGSPNDVSNLINCWPPWRAKGTLFEGGINVPLIIAGAGVRPELRGQVSYQLVNSVDIYATALDIAGKRIPAGSDGVSLLPVLQGSDVPVRNWIYAETFDNVKPPVPCSDHRWTMRDSRYKFIEHIEWQAFFDLQNDPRELNPIPIPQNPGDPGWQSFRMFLREMPCKCQ